MLLDALFPLRCPACGQPGPAACAGCLARFVPAPRGVTPPGLVALRAPFAYEGPARELIARIKYRGAHAAVGVLADAMAAVLEPTDVRGGVVTWAPTTAAHRRSRGFDHAALLAEALAGRLGLPRRALLARRPGPAGCARGSS